MASKPSLSDFSGYLADLVQAGQQSAEKLEEVFSAAIGLSGSSTSLPVKGENSAFSQSVDVQRKQMNEAWRIWNAVTIGALTLGAQTEVETPKGDRRFKDNAWQSGSYFDLLRQCYLLSAKQVQDQVENADVDDKTKRQLRFYARQFIDAMSPSNFPGTNPEVIRKAMETQSASLLQGAANMISDVRKGRITRVDERAFEVGGNLASTPGSVIFENELIQLIQYTPQTATVKQTPLLMVPPCINKYYLLDLGQGNSLVEYAVAQGHTVFLISWRSAVPETAGLTWDDYLRLGPLTAIDVVRDVTKIDKINVLGFCVGGTILSCAAAVLAARGEDKLASITLLTTMLDFADTGDMGVMIDESSVAMREAAIGRGGILPGKELAFTFGTLRASDLIWRYVIDSYLMGIPPEAFDLLYWDSDFVSLPGPMYCWYTRNAYVENNIKVAGRTVQCGVPVDLAKVKAPLYVLAAREDHIVPWRTAYLSTGIFGSAPRFVLAASGHIAGVINPPARLKRSHWLNDDLDDSAESWLSKAQERPGSWWSDWDSWLTRHSDATVNAPEHPGNETYRPIESAPGRYVKAKSN